MLPSLSILQEETLMMLSASQARAWWERKLQRHPSTCKLIHISAVKIVIPITSYDFTIVHNYTCTCVY